MIETNSTQDHSFRKVCPSAESWINKEENADYLSKWGFHLNENMFYDTYYYEPPHVDKSGMKHFLSSLVSVHLNKKMKDIQFSHVKCSETRMDMFDSLKEKGVVNGETDLIRKCPDVYMDYDITVSDCLRRVLFCGDARQDDYSSALLYEDEYEEMSTAIPSEKREEFLYLIMKTLAQGGGVLCQYEDRFKPYFDMTKAIYKDMVSVQRIHKTNELIVCTDVYELKNHSKDLFGASLNPHSTCYVAIDKLNQKCTIWRTLFQTSIL